MPLLLINNGLNLKSGNIKRFGKILLRFVLGLLLLLVVLAITLSLPAVQTKLGQYVTERINSDFNTDITIGKLSVSLFGSVHIQEVLIRDHHQDTLISTGKISTDILSFGNLVKGNLLFGTLRLHQGFLKIRTYKGEQISNLDKFVMLFDTQKKPDEPPFLLTANKVVLQDSRFLFVNDHLAKPLALGLSNLGGTFTHFKVLGPSVAAQIKKLCFTEQSGLAVHHLAGNLAYTRSQLTVDQLSIKTKLSSFSGNVKLFYQPEDFADFYNKVRLKVKVDSSSIASNEVRLYYKDMGQDQVLLMKALFSGTMNHLQAQSASFVQVGGSRVTGDITFLNLLGTRNQPLSLYGDFKEISSSYQQIITLLPFLKNSLPSALQKVGQFSLVGQAGLSTSALSAKMSAKTAIGQITADITMHALNSLSQATYQGTLHLNQFNVGKLLGQQDLGTTSCEMQLQGKGLTKKNIQTTFEGHVAALAYGGYNYQDLSVTGSFKNQIFEGKVNVNDPNLFMDFEGSLTLSPKDIRYDFEAKVDYADLVQLKLITTDSIAVFKGDIVTQIQGTSIDDMRGHIDFRQTSYQNSKDSYLFDDFQINSAFDEQKVRTITINSPDIIEGKVVGKFEFNQLQKMLENSLGSLYTNYSPNKIKTGQFLRFDFSLYSKIVEIFFPDISLSPNTRINGSINADTEDFKLQFNSPQIGAYNNFFHRISVRLDNKNPLYSAYVEVDSIDTGFYKLSDFSLINVTTNDTLFVHSEFKGGKKANDLYNLNLYHTIDKDRNSIVGFDKSDLKIKNYLWHINEQKKADNKIIFDKAFRNFSIDNLVMSRNNQAMVLNGTLTGSDQKDLALTFKNIDVDAITPAIDDFTSTGKLNGVVNLKQNKGIFQPTSHLLVNNLVVNDQLLGDLNVDITGDESFKSFTLNSSLINNQVSAFTAEGAISIIDNQTYTDIDLRLDKLNLAIFESLGGDVLTDLHGYVSGAARVEGLLTKPEVNGRLFLDQAGVTVPYLNVNYLLDDRSIVDVTERAFIIRNALVTDKQYKTRGFVDGRIKHNHFTDWGIDLDIYSDKLLVLDTQDSEDAVYYGTAFINGRAKISGLMDELFVKVDAKSEKGTTVKIPISDAVATGTSGFIHLVTPEEKFLSKTGNQRKLKEYKGLEMEFNFDITPDAEIEVILDRNTGHAMKGRGFGSLLFKINTLGKFNMWGDFQAYEGIYNFKYGGLIDKKFEVKKGGSIVWEGDPLKAVLNLEAVYKTTANPALLLENASFNKKVPTEVVIGIRGNLSNPDPDFDIRFPTVSAVLESEIQYKLADDDTRQTQALYLLSSGGFLSPEGVSQSDLAGNFFERASGLFNDLFQDEDGKFVVGVDYVSPDRRPGSETDGRLGFSVSTQINERITINGKVGVPVGGINESTIVGDVEVLYRVNEDGSLNVKMFNRENDINYIGQGIGYTQGIGINYEVDFDTFKEFANKIFKNIQIDKAVLNPQKKGQEYIQDSGLPDYINMNPNEEEPKKQNQNQEAVPHEE